MQNETLTTATAASITFVSDYVRELVEMENDYPACKRDKQVRATYGTGAYLDLVGNQWRVSISL